MANFNKRSLWVRWWGLVFGAATFIWLPVEDTNTNFLGLIAGGWGVWVASWLYPQGWFKGIIVKSGWRHMVAGGIAGLMVFPIALLLVLVKAGLHGHGFLDFSFYQLERLLVKTPIWILLGGIGGALKGGFSRKEKNNYS